MTRVEERPEAEDDREKEPLARLSYPVVDPSVLLAKEKDDIAEDSDLLLGSCPFPEKLTAALALRRRASLFQTSKTSVQADTRCSRDAGQGSSPAASCKLKLPSLAKVYLCVAVLA